VFDQGPNNPTTNFERVGNGDGRNIPATPLQASTCSTTCIRAYSARGVVSREQSRGADPDPDEQRMRGRLSLRTCERAPATHRRRSSACDCTSIPGGWFCYEPLRMMSGTRENWMTCNVLPGSIEKRLRYVQDSLPGGARVSSSKFESGDGHAGK
jgi:hypothetical protein